MSGAATSVFLVRYLENKARTTQFDIESIKNDIQKLKQSAEIKAQIDSMAKDIDALKKKK